MLIDVTKLTPRVYSNHSRDFQVIARLFNSVLNSNLLNSQLIATLGLDEDFDDELADLLLMTLGIPVVHDYNTRQVLAVCKAFAEVRRHKGSVRALETLLNTLLHVEGITESGHVTVSEDKTTIEIWVPANLSDITLFNDLLRLLLPAGMTSKIIRGAKVTPSDPARTETVAPTVTAYKILSGKSLGGVLNGDGISNSVVIPTDKNTAEGLGANPGFIIHNLVPQADIFAQLPLAAAQASQASIESDSGELVTDDAVEPSEGNGSSVLTEINSNPN